MLKLLAIGHLGKDAITNTTTNGNSVINFSLAHSENFTDKNGNKQSKTTWIDCSWWTDKHAIVPYLKKGTQVFLEGFPEVKSFAKNDGSTGVAMALRVLNCQLLGGQRQEGTSNNNEAQTKSNASKEEGYKPVENPSDLGGPADDLPF